MHVIVEIQQLVEDQIGDLLRRVVGSDARVERVGTGRNAEDDNVGVLGRPADAAGRGQQHNGCRDAGGRPDRQDAAFFRSASALNASIGVMKFGSRMDVFVPPQATVMVSTGQKVRAGETVIARLGPAAS